MNRERLTAFRDALVAHAKNPGNLKFHLNAWAKIPRAYTGEDATKVVCAARLGENFCGTSACALGLAASLPEFNAAGLRLDGAIGYRFASVIYNAPNGGTYWDEGAGAVFFGLDDDDANELFMPNCYARKDRSDPLAVADKITALLETA